MSRVLSRTQQTPSCEPGTGEPGAASARASAADPSGEAGALAGAFCPRGLFLGDRNREGYHKMEPEWENPLPAVGCPLRLCELLLRGQRLCWQGCRQGGQQCCCSLWPGSGSTGSSFLTQQARPCPQSTRRSSLSDPAADAASVGRPPRGPWASSSGVG